MLMRSRAELHAFVENLRVPASRREVILAELEDHAFGEIAEAEAAGIAAAEAERMAFVSLGPLDRLRERFERSDGAFGLLPGSAAHAGTRLALVFLSVLAVLGMTEGVAQHVGWWAWQLGAGEERATFILHGVVLSGWLACVVLLRCAGVPGLLRALRGDVAPWSRAALVASATTLSLAGIFVLPLLDAAILSAGIWTALSSAEVALEALTLWALLSVFVTAAAFLPTTRRRVSA